MHRSIERHLYIYVYGVRLYGSLDDLSTVYHPVGEVRAVWRRVWRSPIGGRGPARRGRRRAYGVRMATRPIGSRVSLNYDLMPAE